MRFLDWATVRARALLGTTALLITLLAGGCTNPVEDSSNKPVDHSSKQCGAMPCRPNGVPYVTDKGAIVIFPGEQFVIALKIEDGKIVGAEPIPAGGSLTSAVEVSFKQIDSGMMLTVANHLPRTIKYDAIIKAPDDRMVYTTSCPVRVGLSTFEGWPHPIKFLELSNFRFQDEGPCE